MSFGKWMYLFKQNPYQLLTITPESSLMPLCSRSHPPLPYRHPTTRLYVFPAQFSDACSTSCQWNRTVCTLLCPVPFVHHTFFETHHLIVYVSGSFLFIAGQYSTVGTCCCLFMHTPMMNTCFPAIVNKAALSIQAQVFCRHVFSFLLSK